MLIFVLISPVHHLRIISAHPDLSKAFVELGKDATLVKHLPLISVLVVLLDLPPQGRGQLPVRHVLFHLFDLQQTPAIRCI